MGFDDAFARSDATWLVETGRQVEINGRPVVASVGPVSADNEPADGGPIPGASARVTISSDDFTELAVKVGSRVLVSGAVSEKLQVLGIRGSGILRILFCGATGAGRTSEF
jgi:hypothetical protein